MKIVDSIPFAAELLSPTYGEVFRREGVVAGEGDVALGPDWVRYSATSNPMPPAPMIATVLPTETWSRSTSR